MICDPASLVNQPLDAECPLCRHRIGDHTYPSGRCLPCSDQEMRQGMIPTAAFERKDNQLTDAVTALTEAVLHLAEIIGRDRVF